MSRRLLAALCLLAASAKAADKAPPTPSVILSEFVRFQAPKNWRAEEYANGGGADPVRAFVDGSDRITVRLFGAPGSGYKNPAAFLAGPAATTMGRKPESAGTVAAAGRRLPLYRRGFPLTLGDPHGGSSPRGQGRELFCILPAAKGRFVVLSYARESSAPDLDKRGSKAWEAFLKTVKLVGRKT